MQPTTLAVFREVLRAPGSGCVPPAATLGCKQEGFAQHGVPDSDSWPLWQFRRGTTGVTQSGESRTRLQRNSGYCFRKWAFMTRTGTRQLSTMPAPGQHAQPAWRSYRSQAQLHPPPPRGEGLTNSGGSGGCQGTRLDPAASGGEVQPPQSNQQQGRASTPGRYTHTHMCNTHVCAWMAAQISTGRRTDSTNSLVLLPSLGTICIRTYVRTQRGCTWVVLVPPAAGLRHAPLQAVP